MTIITASNLAKGFDGNSLFANLSFKIEAKAKIGLTGINGSGKTTLFRILTGEMKADSGSIHYDRHLKIGYMEQQIANADLTLIQAVGQVFAPLKALEEQINQINSQLEQQTTPSLLNKQHTLREEFAAKGGYTYQSRLRASLRGLGFSEEEIDLPLSALSGGQRSKALLARALLTEADILLLDEPTNHLDIEAMEWLENYLAAYSGALIIISHDRYFLDKLTTTTWEMTFGQLYEYRGNYSQAQQKKQAREDSLKHRQDQAKKEAKRIEEMIAQQKRFNQARNYRTIAHKQKSLNRVEAEIEQLNPLAAEAKLSFKFNAPPPGGNDIWQLFDISKSFGERKLFSDINLHINKGERIFLLGGNGCGKTTLLKIILGQIIADSGYIKQGINIIPGYFDQLASGLNPANTILEEMFDSYPLLSQSQIRSALGRFLFKGDDVFKPISALSGGEKARLTLLKLMLRQANFLILDEPTNHLDLASKEAIEQALLDYPGTMLIVSHDRYLINRLATKIYVLAADGLSSYWGNYDNYLAKMEQLKAINSPPPAIKKAAPKGDYALRKEAQSQLRKAKHNLEKKEAACALCEQELAAVDLAIEQAATDYQQLAILAPKREEIQMRLEQCFAEWEQAEVELDQLS